MNKAELVHLLQSKLLFQRKTLKKAINAVVDTISTALTEGVKRSSWLDSVHLK